MIEALSSHNRNREKFFIVGMDIYSYDVTLGIIFRSGSIFLVLCFELVVCLQFSHALGIQRISQLQKLRTIDHKTIIYEQAYFATTQTYYR